MPTWGQILKEMEATRPRLPDGKPDANGRPDYDKVRRKYIHELNQYTKRPVILYATAFLETRNVPPLDLQVNLVDVQGLMECVAGVKERSLDLILHSPGGSAEATESIVSYLRTKFDHIRVFVPLAAMSAATMIALAADEIVMARHSQLGPIDPQFIVLTPEGPRSSPGQAILDQFRQAKEECKDPANLTAWLPILRGYAPGLLSQCKDQQDLAKRMVGEWLAGNMFRGEDEAQTRATKIAEWFGNYKEFKSHGRPVRIEHLRELGLKVSALEDDQQLQDAVLSVHHAMMHTFSGTPATKIIENHLGNAFVRLSGYVVVPAQPDQRPAATREVQPSAPVTRAQRRAAERQTKRG